MLKLVSWGDQEKVMNQEEIDDFEADEKSQEVDSREVFLVNSPPSFGNFRT